MKRQLLNYLILLALLTGCTPIQRPVDATAASPTTATGLTVDALQPLGPISPYVYGTNYGPWVSLNPGNFPLAEAAGLKFIRFPGGNWGDRNELQKTQVDSFVALCKKFGAEPFIVVRFPDSTPEKAAELVRYANVQKQFNIKFWAIGNEPSLYEAEGRPFDVPTFAAEWRKFAEAMRAVDPTIQLIGPEVHQFLGTPEVDPRDSQGKDWLRDFLKLNGDLLDYVSVHRYPFPNNEERTSAKVDELRDNAPQWDTLVENLRNTVKATTGRDIPLAVDEVSSHWTNAMGAETTGDSFFHAIWWADVLGRLIRGRVAIVAHWLLVSGPDVGHGILGRYDVRPTYYVYLMYKPLGDQLVTSSSSDPVVTITAATRSDDGALTLVIVNRAASEKRLPLLGVIDRPRQVLLFDKTHNAEVVDLLSVVQPEGESVMMVLPAESIITIVFPPTM